MSKHKNKGKKSIPKPPVYSDPPPIAIKISRLFFIQAALIFAVMTISMILTKWNEPTMRGGGIMNLLFGIALIIGLSLFGKTIINVQQRKRIALPFTASYANLLSVIYVFLNCAIDILRLFQETLGMRPIVAAACMLIIAFALVFPTFLIQQWMKKNQDIIDYTDGDPKKIKEQRGAVGEWIETIIFALFMALFIKAYAVEANKVPTNSMYPTIHGAAYSDISGKEHDYPYQAQQRSIWLIRNAGYRQNPNQLLAKKVRGADFLLVNKFIYGAWVPGTFIPFPQAVIDVFKFRKLRDPRRGDIIVFSYPYNEKRPFFIKRCIALPGETIQVSNYRVFINGKRLDDRAWISLTDTEYDAWVESMTINGHYQGVKTNDMYMPPKLQNEYSISNIIARGYFDRSTGKLIKNNKSDHVILTFDLANFGPYTLKDDEFFMMGDNRDESFDSRAWGPIHRKYIRGKAFWRYWPIWRFAPVK